MQIKETLAIENPFKKTGKLWTIFSVLGLVGGIILLLTIKNDFQNLRASTTTAIIDTINEVETQQDEILTDKKSKKEKAKSQKELEEIQKEKEAEEANQREQAKIQQEQARTQYLALLGIFLIKLFAGLTLLGIGIKYLRVALSVLFKYDPDKKLTENLAKEVHEDKNKSFYVYGADSLFKILQTRVLELIKPTTLIENITTRIFLGLKHLPPRYFYVSQNFLNAIAASASPFIILVIALFLNYLEIINIFSGNRFDWIILLISVSVLFSWSPFSPITNNNKVDYKALILSICSIGTILIIRTTALDYSLPEIPATVLIVALLFILLSAGIFYSFFFLLKRRIEIEGTNDSITVTKEDFDLDIHPDEIHRIISNRMSDLGNLDLINREYYNSFGKNENSFKMTIMQETQPVPRHTIKDSILSYTANKLSLIGFVISSVGVVALIILTNTSSTFVGLLLSTIASFGIINFGLKLIHLCGLFLSEYLFESKLLTVVANGEFKSAQVTAGRGIHDNVESKNEVTRTSISLQLASTSVVSVSFMRMGLSNPFEGTSRYIVSLSKDDESVAYLTKTLAAHIYGKSQIAGVSNQKDLENIKNMSSLNKTVTSKEQKLIDNDLDDLIINDN